MLCDSWVLFAYPVPHCAIGITLYCDVLFCIVLCPDVIRFSLCCVCCYVLYCVALRFVVLYCPMCYVALRCIVLRFAVLCCVVYC